MEVEGDIHLALNSTQDADSEEDVKSTPGFQMFLMTGDAIIQKDKPVKAKNPKLSKFNNKTNSNNFQCGQLTTKSNTTSNSSSNTTLSNSVSNDDAVPTTNTDTVNNHSSTAAITHTVHLSTDSSAPSNSPHTAPYSSASVKEANYDRKEFVPGFMRPEVEDVEYQASSPEASTPRESITSSHSSLGSLDSDDISLDMNNLLSANTQQQVDEPSASRLAKRLFYLDGFKRSDVSYQLTRNNQFSQKVAEDYLSYFDFASLDLVEAMRKFFNHFALIGETQERERVLAHFTRRYIACNPSFLETSCKTEDACHTLVCALMLLNTDLHGQNLGKRMVLSDFMENLAGFNHNTNYPKDLLKMCYISIKNQPFVWAKDDNPPSTSHRRHTNGVLDASMPSDLIPTSHPVLPHQYQTLPANSFVSLPNAKDATEYKRGVLLKKSCKGPDGVKVPSGKRGWKRYYVILMDMVLYLLKSDKHSISHSSSKAILLHHSLASVARSYKKRPYVFCLQTADWSEYLMSISNVSDLEDWVNTINLVSATLSSKPLAAPVGSQKKFHRPLLPSAHTKLSLGDQCRAHEERVNELRQVISEEEKYPPQKKTSRTIQTNYRDKLLYLKHEMQRYLIYAQLLRAKLDQFPELDISLANSTIGEVDEVQQAASTDDASTDNPTDTETVSTDPTLQDRAAGNSLDLLDAQPIPTAGMYINLESETTYL